jgi:hypothetical protein
MAILWRSKQASTAQRADNSERLATEASTLCTTRPDLALLLAVEAYWQEPTDHASAALVSIALSSPGLRGYTTAPNSASLLPNLVRTRHPRPQPHQNHRTGRSPDPINAPSRSASGSRMPANAAAIPPNSPFQVEVANRSARPVGISLRRLPQHGSVTRTAPLFVKASAAERSPCRGSWSGRRHRRGAV